MKKRSGANSNSKPPEAIVFFLDRSLGKKVIPERLRQAGAKVEIHDDHFLPDAKDEDWLGEVGRRGWVILTKDQWIRYRTPELLAVKRAGARVFVLTARDLQGGEMADIFANALARISRFAVKHRPPFIARVTRGAFVSMWVSSIDFR